MASRCRRRCPGGVQARAAVLLVRHHSLHLGNEKKTRARTVAGDTQVGPNGVQARAPVLLVWHHVLLAGNRRRAGTPARVSVARRRVGRNERALRRRGALGARVAARVRVGRRLVRRCALARERRCEGDATSSQWSAELFKPSLLLCTCEWDCTYMYDDTRTAEDAEANATAYRWRPHAMTRAAPRSVAGA